MRTTIALTLLAAMASSVVADPVATERRQSRVVAAWSLAGVGGALAVGSIGLGFAAHRKYEAAFEGDHCVERDGGPLCNATGYRETHAARTMGTVATGFGVAGLGLLATAAIVYYTAPRDTVTIAPALGTDGAGLAVAGRF